MKRAKKPVFKTRSPHQTEAEPGEPVWGNGCEHRGCRQPSEGTFLMCVDGIRREFCALHGSQHGQPDPAAGPCGPSNGGAL